MIPRTKVLQAVIVAWSFTWTLLVGHLGIFALDQSLVFDGGWRIFSGQVPFRDFIMPFPPLTFWLQAAFFKVFGVSWTSQVLSAACCGGIAALSAMRTIHLLFGKPRRWLILGAGFLVGTSFQSMFGTLYMELLGFLFSFSVFRRSASRWSVCRDCSRCASPRLVRFPFCLPSSNKISAFCLRRTCHGDFSRLPAIGGPRPWPALRLCCGRRSHVRSLLWLATAFSDPHLFLRYAIQVPAK